MKRCFFALSWLIMLTVVISCGKQETRESKTLGIKTIGIEQLRHASWVLKQHRANAEYYRTEMKRRKIKRCRPLSYEPDRTSSYWLFTIMVDNRDAFVRWMTDAGIQVSQVHSRCDTHSCFKEFSSGYLPGVDQFTEHQVSIPVHWALTEHEKRYIMLKMEEFERV